MALFAGSNETVKDTAGTLSSHSHWLVWAAALILLIGVTVPDGRVSYLFLAGGGAVAGLAFFTRLLGRAATPSDDIAAVRPVLEHDYRAALVANQSGEILHKNPAARTRFGNTDGKSLEKVLEDVCTQPNAVVFRLQAKADKQNAAREDVATPKGRSILSVHRAGEDCFVWMVDDAAERVTTARSVDKISLPMMTVSGTGSILFMNDAMRRFAGGRVKSVDKLLNEPDVVSGQITTVAGIDGPSQVRVIITSAGAGRTEYFFAPLEDGRNGSETLESLEDFPVALLKISSHGTLLEANKLARALMGLDQWGGSNGASGEKRVLSDLLEGLGRPMSEWLSEAAEGRSLHKPEVLKARNREEEIYLQVTLGRMIRNGEVVLLAMISDATELKTLEAQFVQSQKMQAIGQLAGGVAHDFNNLLTAISGHCDLLMLRHDPGDPDFGDLEQINQNANRAASLVGQLLAFSRKQNLQLEILDMRDTLADLTHLLNRLVGAQIQLTLSHDPQLMSVRADRRQLEQVLMNLVVNARDAMEGGGEINIETRNMKLQSELTRDRAVVPPGEYVLVKVSDNGCGIPQDKLNKIFEPFFTTKRTGKGTGLGLSTAYGIVKQSGGFIFVDSEVGKGTAFTIYFPTSQLPVQEDVAKEEVPVRMDPVPAEGVVLLVEDEAPVRAFASRALKLRGYSVLEADCAEEALSMLEDSDLIVDVVVTDVVMPGMDGPTWVRMAREARPDMKVVFVSGYTEGNFGENQEILPNTVFLPKPFSLNELTSTVQSQMSVAA
ncbi:ATP-binding protein [Litoreibacter roseus]|uniref:histidine kinase n=1 Tax=Litoreibacter roseus TaxID=2601869 RepID=A0A6N6JDS0_9RHOB|nr:ATP-binding protein [Litoreibacter roseus]GFE64284.1 hybrid sensor histidine kinase/response regulator [Litoreibacter roseus]